MVEKDSYSTSEDHDGISEGHASIPKGWLFYVLATILWMLYYVYAYTPIFTGWTQAKGIGG